jgi:hypothetical protein
MRIDAPRTLVLLTAALALVFVTGYLLASVVSVDKLPAPPVF